MPNVSMQNSRTTIEGGRGVYITEWVAVFDIVVLSGGNTNISVRGKSKSFIDITVNTTK